MNRERVEKVAEAARMIQTDCEADAIALDGKPFDGRTVAESLGTILAMVGTLAKAVEVIVEEMVLDYG